MIQLRPSRSVPPEAPRKHDPSASDFERLGGEPGLRIIIDDFLDRVFSDVMIGFHFDKAPQARIRVFEYRWAAAHLGGPVSYDGRPMVEAHAAHRIFDGHFARRIAILRETLAEHDVPADVATRWIAHDEAQRDQVLAGTCR